MDRAALERASDSYARDLLAAVRAWRSAPWLPVISVLLGASVWSLGAFELATQSVEEQATTLDPSAASWLALVLPVVALLELGWWGTEREVYRRVWVGDQDPAERLGRTTLGYVGRFLRLGLLMVLPLLVVPMALVPVSATAAAVTGYVATAAVFVALTFVTPQLTYRTPRATEALSQGFSLLVTRFPEVAWHAVLTALLVVTLDSAAGATVGREVVRFVVTAVAVLVGLATKGAAARRWLVVHDQLSGSGARPAPAQPRG